MTGLMFGEPDWPLFGQFDEPAGGGRCRRVAVLCAPFGEEAIRAHRTFAVLAERLCAAGIGVFRFDWFATGDSAGEDHELTLDRVQESLQLAHEEALDMSGAPKAVWIGLRLGANVACLTAKKSMRELAGVLAWDPIRDVATYTAEVKAAHAAFVEISAGGEPQPDEAFGYPLPTEFYGSLSAQPVTTAIDELGQRACLVAAENPAEHPYFKTDTMADVWNSDQALNAYVIPTDTIKAIVDEVTSW